jgi:hypothetical protein
VRRWWSRGDPPRTGPVSEALDLNLSRWAWRRSREQVSGSKIWRWIGPFGAGAIAAVPGLVLHDEIGAIAGGGAATVLGELLPTAVVFPVRLLMASGEQRRTLQHALRPELDDPQFTCRCSLDKTSVVLTVGNENYQDNVLLWVRVENEGPAGDFSARLLRFRGLPGVADRDFEVSEVAWEPSLEKSLHLVRGGFARLRIGAFSLNPRALWFYAARSATWAQASHQATPRFSDYYGECHFDLVVHNETADRTRTFQATISVTTDGTLGFRIDENGKNAGLHVMAPNMPVLGGATGVAGVLEPANNLMGRAGVPKGGPTGSTGPRMTADEKSGDENVAR